jgi:hypothetical protein
MSTLEVARANAPAATRAPGASLAARIPIPVTLPPRHDGERLRHLSHSSVALFLDCPEAWRLRYLQGRREPPSGAMFLGSRVDDALSHYYRHRLEQGQCLDVDQVADFYRERWAAAIEEEDAKQGVDWGEVDAPVSFELGRQALALAFAQLIPKLGQPVAVQRELEFTLAELEWTILCYLDLETTVEGIAGEIHRVVDYKVKGSAISKWQADRDPQAGLYLAGRWLEGSRCDELCFAQLLKPGRQRKQLGAALTATSRSIGQMRTSLARIAQVASQINAYYDAYGPDRSWGFANPTGWRCSPRFCAAYMECPGGGGL